MASAAIVVAAIGLGRVRGAIFGKPSQAQPAAPTAYSPGTFQPTPEQLANLRIEAVVKHTFRTEVITEGRIAANGDRTTPVFSPYSGRITKILAAPGDLVRRGAPLFTLEANEFVQGQNDLAAAAAALATARSQLRHAQISEQRKHALYDIGAGSLQDWQQAQAELASARNTVRSAEVALAAVRNRLRILGKSAAQVAALEHAERVDPVATVAAPIGGTVIERQVGIGQYIQSGAPDPLFKIGDLSTVWLVANVREADAPSLRRGAAVEVRVLALPQKVFKARLTYVAPAVDPNTRRLAVRAEIPNPDGVLKPEMFASFTIVAGDESAAIGIAERAILYEGESARVWVLRGDGALALRPIRTGRHDNGTIEVLSGLAAGEKIVTSGSLFIDRAAQRD